MNDQLDQCVAHVVPETNAHLQRVWIVLVWIVVVEQTTSSSLQLLLRIIQQEGNDVLLASKMGRWIRRQLLFYFTSECTPKHVL